MSSQALERFFGDCVPQIQLRVASSLITDTFDKLDAGTLRPDDAEHALSMLVHFEGKVDTDGLLDLRSQLQEHLDACAADPKLVLRIEAAAEEASDNDYVPSDDSEEDEDEEEEEDSDEAADFVRD